MAVECRFCQTELRDIFVDLGMSPLSNAFLSESSLDKMEPFFPLKTWVCGNCKLVQLEEYETPENIFNDYFYFSSYADLWLKHAEAYTSMAVERFGLNSNSQVIEIASNDGYLLQYFKKRNIPVLGIEPAGNVAEKAVEKGLETIIDFFGAGLATKLLEKSISGDLVLGNNVLAHVPDLNDFVAGLKLILKPNGTITMEFPHLLRLIRESQFDTIYHEHFSYFSLYTVMQVFVRHGLRIYDVEQLPTHGGSLRIYVCHGDNVALTDSDVLKSVLLEEERQGLHSLQVYLGFSAQVQKCKRSLLRFLMDMQEQGKVVVGYGAPAKGNTLLNYCGIRTDLLAYTVDRSPHKQGKYLPGVHIPVHEPERIRQDKPDYVLILPWNLQAEITEQMREVREWGGKFVVPVPEIQVLP